MLVKNIMLHTGVIYDLEKMGMGLLWTLIILALSILISMILMIDVFNKPLKAIQKLVNKFKVSWCIGLLGILAAAGVIFTFLIP